MLFMQNTFECLLLAEIFQAMSSVWSYFSKVIDAGNNNEVAQCKFCSKSLQIPKSKTTSNLLEHIRKKHKEEAESFVTQSKDESEDRANNQPKLDHLFDSLYFDMQYYIVIYI